uniref:Uncharacterized protein n=1 Tax=Arundo donax TaxID=35708 RepID=A0A0A9BGK5_ARUDO
MLKNILQLYKDCSGQCLNVDKSSIIQS